MAKLAGEWKKLISDFALYTLAGTGSVKKLAFPFKTNCNVKFHGRRVRDEPKFTKIKRYKINHDINMKTSTWLGANFKIKVKKTRTKTWKMVCYYVTNNVTFNTIFWSFVSYILVLFLCQMSFLFFITSSCIYCVITWIWKGFSGWKIQKSINTEKLHPRLWPNLNISKPWHQQLYECNFI